jgi:formamidopyrimidine-DNA glycosylase
VPELPEVETLRRQLQAALPGRGIVGTWISPDAPQLLRGVTPSEFEQSVCGRTIESVERSGKWLILRLSGDIALVMHLRMTGRVLLRVPTAPVDAYMRAKITLDDGEIRWCDVRKFGTWDLVGEIRQVTGSMGPEPLGSCFTAANIVQEAAGRRAPIKAFLLDQRRVAGLGNIYTDEALWDAGINPLRPAGTLTLAEAERLREAIVAVLVDSLESGGSSMRDYLDTAGKAGRFQERWRVYKREGTPCSRCSEAIQRIVIGGRGTRFCPGCQPDLKPPNS